MFTFEVDEEITLRLLERKDALELFTLIDNSRDYLREWLGWIDSTKTVKDSEQFIQGSSKVFEMQSGLILGIFYHGKLAGITGFNTLDWNNHIGVIGYWLGQGFQGKGIMTRAVTGLMEYGFDHIGLNRLELRAATGNIKSRAIAERLGFVKEGLIRQGEWLYDHYVDLVVYAMLVSEWEMGREK